MDIDETAVRRLMADIRTKIDELSDIHARLGELVGMDSGTRRMGRGSLTGEGAARLLRQMRGVSARRLK